MRIHDGNNSVACLLRAVHARPGRCFISVYEYIYYEYVGSRAVLLAILYSLAPSDNRPAAYHK
eukprot:scaffold165008_cov37-Prasinocladus_malaysianus.AAC.1